MLVYGDRQRTEDPRAVLRRIASRLAGLEHVFPGIARHSGLTAAFIEAGELAQGLADAEFEARGGDGPSPVQDAAMALVMHLARAIAASWRSVHTNLPPICEEEIAALDALPLPDRITIKTPEGYAFYAVYPEGYLEAAAGLKDHPTVVGIRSIGTGLAAMVAVGADSRAPATVRPVGHPFHRELKLLQPLAGESFAIVDEGPGLSGSSFAAVASAAKGEVTLIPSHDGEPGSQASDATRERWRSARKLVAAFEPADHVSAWFSDVLGEPVGPLRDISGGAWRQARGVDAPADLARECRKFLLRTASGDWLLKFAGLGRIGEEKFERAWTLHAAGFVPEPVAFRHGFIAERWYGEAKAAPPSPDHLRDYLSFRAQMPASAEEGASLDHLARMAAYNTGQALGEAHGERIAAHLASLNPGPIRRVHTDGRLHAWEWLALPDNRTLKADAIDHDNAHDLIGCQDIAWDVAGAKVELGIALDGLCDPQMLAFMLPCYAAFQLGLWTFAGDREQAQRYAAVLAATG